MQISVFPQQPRQLIKLIFFMPSDNVRKIKVSISKKTVKFMKCLGK